MSCVLPLKVKFSLVTYVAKAATKFIRVVLDIHALSVLFIIILLKMRAQLLRDS